MTPLLLLVVVIAAIASSVLVDTSAVVDATENTKKQQKWKEFLSKVFPGKKKRDVCAKGDGGACESSERRGDQIVAQESSKWREFLLKLLKYFKRKSVANDEMSKEQTSRWQLFVAYIESNLKVMVSESSETIKKSVKKSFDTIRSKTKRFKASKDPYVLVQYTASLSLNQLYGIVKAYNQVVKLFCISFTSSTH